MIRIFSALFIRFGMKTVIERAALLLLEIGASKQSARRKIKETARQRCRVEKRYDW
jgi:hypothetical protein